MATKAAKKKSRITPEGRAKIAAAQHKRWHGVGAANLHAPAQSQQPNTRQGAQPALPPDRPSTLGYAEEIERGSENLRARLISLFEQMLSTPSSSKCEEQGACSLNDRLAHSCDSITGAHEVLSSIAEFLGYSIVLLVCLFAVPVVHAQDKKPVPPPATAPTIPDSIRADYYQAVADSMIASANAKQAQDAASAQYQRLVQACGKDYSPQQDQQKKLFCAPNPPPDKK